MSSVSGSRPARFIRLPDQGMLMVSTDLHGNLEDLDALTRHFNRLCATGRDAYWVILGDLVHGPDDDARARNPTLYGFRDQSFEVVDAASVLMREHPGKVILVLGNHDHAHVGGARTSKFHPDEAAWLESRLSERQRALIRSVFENAALVVAAPCGALLCHGAPDTSLFDVRQLDWLELDYRLNDGHGQWLLSSLLTSYGQPDELIRQMLGAVSVSAGMRLTFLIHGHDRDESGFYLEGRHQLCPVLFGAPRDNKRFVLLDLSQRYPDALALREELEILRVH